MNSDELNTILTDRNIKFSDENRIKIILFKITDLFSEVNILNPSLTRLNMLGQGLRTGLYNLIGFGTEEDYSSLMELLDDIEKKCLIYNKSHVSRRKLIELVLDIRRAYLKFLALYRLTGLGLSVRRKKEDSRKQLERALIER